MINMSLKVTVNITGCLKELYPHLSEQEVVESDQPLSVSGLIGELGISPRMVLFAVLNERIVPKDRQLFEDCEINLVSPPAGG